MAISFCDPRLGSSETCLRSSGLGDWIETDDADRRGSQQSQTEILRVNELNRAGTFALTEVPDCSARIASARPPSPLPHRLVDLSCAVSTRFTTKPQPIELGEGAKGWGFDGCCKAAENPPTVSYPLHGARNQNPDDLRPHPKVAGVNPNLGGRFGSAERGYKRDCGRVLGPDLPKRRADNEVRGASCVLEICIVSNWGRVLGWAGRGSLVLDVRSLRLGQAPAWFRVVFGPGVKRRGEGPVPVAGPSLGGLRRSRLVGCRCLGACPRRAACLPG